MKKCNVFILLLLITLTQAKISAQESVNTTGGEGSGSGGSVSYSIGQVVYQTYSAVNGSVAQGVQQPYEISIVTSIEEANCITLSVLAYPNPTADNLTLEIKNFDYSDLSYHMFDINGRLLQSKKITESQTKITMGNLVTATYFVKVMQANREIKIFKIIKN